MDIKATDSDIDQPITIAIETRTIGCGRCLVGHPGLDLMCGTDVFAHACVRF